jgi:hypothetical protein
MWGDIATWAGVLVAVVLAVLARRDASASSDAAARSAAAAERTAAAQAEIAARWEPAWELQRQSGAVLLWNRNREDALDVRIEPEAPWFVMDGSAHHARIPSASSVMFVLATDSDSSFDHRLVVTWRRPNGSPERHTWSVPVLWGLV